MEKFLEHLKNIGLSYEEVKDTLNILVEAGKLSDEEIALLSEKLQSWKTESEESEDNKAKEMVNSVFELKN